MIDCYFSLSIFLFFLYIFLFFLFFLFIETRARVSFWQIIKKNLKTKKWILLKKCTKQKKKQKKNNFKILYGTGFSSRWIVIPWAWQTQLCSSSQNDHFSLSLLVSIERKHFWKLFCLLNNKTKQTIIVILFTQFLVSISTYIPLFSFDPVNDLLRYYLEFF